MRIKPLLPALFVFTATSALATTSPECKNGTCQATVTITACDANGKAAGTVAPNNIHVDKGVWQIHWTLSGAKFTANGVQFAQNPGKPSGGKVFEDAKKLDDTHFKWKDSNETKGGPFKYSTEVTFNGKTCTLDPDISND